MNKVILIGNVGQDIELRYTQSGKAVCNFSLATNDFKDSVEWHSITAWDKTAELLAQYVGKGSKVGIDGRLQTKKWTDRDGNDRYKTDIVCNSVEFLSKRDGDGQSSVGKSSSGQNGGGYQQQNGYQAPPNEDDIPF